MQTARLGPILLTDVWTCTLMQLRIACSKLEYMQSVAMALLLCIQALNGEDLRRFCEGNCPQTVRDHLATCPDDQGIAATIDQSMYYVYSNKYYSVPPLHACMSHENQ